MGASVPILTYHSIAPGERLGPDLFGCHLEALSRSGLASVSPGDLDRAGQGFLLTFDDGFADLWTHALPLLRHRGVRATVFAIPSRAGEGEPRPVGVAAWTRGAAEAHREASLCPGPHPAFLRWSELEALEATGLVTVQSHSWSHRMGWVGDEIVGFHRGRSHWSLAQCTGGDDRPGIPLYRRGSALAHRLYRDDPGLRDHLARRAQTGASDAELRAEARRYRDEQGDRGTWEAADERRRRTADEIVRAREALEARLGGTRDELCLPWGEYDEVTLECARAAGIRRVYTLDRGPNPAGRIGFLVNRFEPRPKGALWLRGRLWVYRSARRAHLYAALSHRS